MQFCLDAALADKENKEIFSAFLYIIGQEGGGIDNTFIFEASDAEHIAQLARSVRMIAV
ncbi:hypothetical protein ACJMK2_008349 [Sinanodonta woodiana]|uniref:Uncharacterized protein n=1 Tax=Sinanodonta woodiana TaxID=1069815 RepID=A0ABD3VPA5_SINWO